jgi:hypothetical protein
MRGEELGLCPPPDLWKTSRIEEKKEINQILITIF